MICEFYTNRVHLLVYVGDNSHFALKK